MYEFGRLSGPILRKGAWVWRSVAGSEDESIEAEFAVGRDMANAFLRELALDTDEATRAQVAAVGAALASRVKNKQRAFAFSIVAADAPNAFALPGGFIFVTRNLLDLIGERRDETAFILAHEMGHVIQQDPMQRILTDAAIAAAVRALPAAGVAGSWIASAGARFLESSYSQDRELAADELGVRLARAAGFDPAAAPRLLERLQAAVAARSRGDVLAPYFSTHPPFPVRVRALKRFLKIR